MSQNYKIIVGFDDSQMQKLSKQFAGTFGGQQTGGAAGGLGGNTALFKNLTKLGIIATASIGALKGIEKLVSLTVSSSPMLGTMLKLLNTAVMFILRPIGDFIGFFLRPMLVYFLRNIALPIYKEWAPVMRKLGGMLGANFLLPIESALSFFTQEISAKQKILDEEHTAATTRNRDAMLDFKEALNNVAADLRSGTVGLDFQALMTNLSTQITSVLTGLGVGILGMIDFSGLESSTKLWIDNFTKNVNDVSRAVSTGFTSFIAFFDGLGTNLSVLYTGVILPGIATISEFFTNMIIGISDVIAETVTAISNVFKDIFEFFTNIPNMIMNSIFPQTEQQAPVSGEAQQLGVNINFYDTLVQGAESITDFGSSLSSQLQDVLAGRSS